MHQFFQSSLEPKEILKNLSIYSGISIEKGETLIIFDEVQECPEALNSLKYFNEEANEYHIVAAGSLLGVKTANKKGFPVGKVNFLSLYPLNFFEFLSATNNDMLRELLEEIDQFEPISIPIHDRLIKLKRTKNSFFPISGKELEEENMKKLLFGLSMQVLFVKAL